MAATWSPRQHPGSRARSIRRAEEERRARASRTAAVTCRRTTPRPSLIAASYSRRPSRGESDRTRRRSHRTGDASAAMIGAAPTAETVAEALCRWSASCGSRSAHATGQGRARRNRPVVARQRRAVGRRFRAPRDRRRRLHRQHRPRRDREATVLHARGPAHGDPRQLRRRRSRCGVFPADRGGRRHRQRRVAADRIAVAAAALGLHLLRPRAHSALANLPNAPATTLPDGRAASSPMLRPRSRRTTSSASTNGLYKLWFRAIPAQRQTRCCSDNALATMGRGLPSAIAPPVHPGRRVVAVCGDGGS